MTKFEIASSVINSSNADDLRENCIYWLDGDKEATINVNGRSRYATRLRKLANDYPEEVKILSDEDGRYLVACIPVKAVKINIVKREMTDEQKQRLVQTLAKTRESSADS